MTASAAAAGTKTVDRNERGRIVHDLLLLAELHASALDRDTASALWAKCYDGLLAYRPAHGSLTDSLQALCRSLTEIPTCFDTDTATGLREDFCRLYGAAHGGDRARQSTWRTTPAESRPIDVAAICEWGKRRGYDEGAWLELDQDQLAAQLRLLAYLVAPDGVAAPAQRVRDTLQQQLLSWFGTFAKRASTTAHTRFYRELAALTMAYLETIYARVETACQISHADTYQRASMPHGTDVPNDHSLPTTHA